MGARNENGIENLVKRLAEKIQNGKLKAFCLPIPDSIGEFSNNSFRVRTGFLLLLVCGHDDHFSGGMLDVEFSNHCRRVRSEENLLNVVLDDFVHSIGTVRSLHRVAQFLSHAIHKIYWGGGL